MDSCTVDPKCALYLHLTWYSNGFRSLAWLTGENTGVVLSGSDPLDPFSMRETVENLEGIEHIILHLEGDEDGPAAVQAHFDGALRLPDLLGYECDFDQLAAEAGSSQHLIEPPGVRSGLPIPARELWLIPTGAKHPNLTSMRPMQANSRRKAAHLEDVQRMATLHIEQRRALGCEPSKEGGGRPIARRGGRRTGRLSPER